MSDPEHLTSPPSPVSLQVSEANLFQTTIEEWALEANALGLHERAFRS